MIHALKDFTLRGEAFGPPRDLTPYRTAVATATARVAQLTAAWERLRHRADAVSEHAALAEAQDVLARATAGLAAARLRRRAQVPDDVWAQESPRLRALLTRNKFVLNAPGRMPRKGSRQRRAAILAQSR